MAKTRTPSSEQARRDFLCRFFHDLATPLSAVSLHLAGADRRLGRGQDPSGALETARHELEKAFELFERGRELLLETPAQPEVFGCDDWVRETVDSRGHEGIRVRGATLARLRGDRRGLTDALASLLENAVESSSPPAVTVSLERRGGRLLIRVENAGRLPGDDPEKLFSPSAASAGKRWGMGLARARLHAAGAGGTLTLEEKEGSVMATLDLPEGDGG